jgi:hypothetical protein
LGSYLTRELLQEKETGKLGRTMTAVFHFRTGTPLALLAVVNLILSWSELGS